MKEKVVVLGAGGMLAYALIPLLKKNYEVVGFAHGEAEITDEKTIFALVQKEKPQWVVNLAAYTDVDGCESNADRAFRVNAEGARIVAAACQAAQAKMIHISTDFIFDGSKKSPYVETDPAKPQSVYARSKYEGERFVRQVLPESSLIVRTSWLYGAHGKNFVDTILRSAREKKELKVVNDQVGRPTYTKDMAEALIALMERKAAGVVHFANRGECSWYDYACEIVKLAGLNSVTAKPISSAELNRPAKRPPYSVLSTEKYEKMTGKPIRHWRETLKEYLG